MKYKAITSLVLGMLISISSCTKKGENDPSLSLKTRKARITNEWKVSLLASNTVNESNGIKTETDYKFNGMTVVLSVKQTINEITVSTLDSNTTVEVADYSINSDGTFSTVWNEKRIVIIDDLFGDGYNTTTKITQNSTDGKWSFIGKSKGDYKNKERIVFNVLNSKTIIDENSIYNVNSVNGNPQVEPTETNTIVYSIGDEYTIYSINQLKSKEVILTQDRSSTIAEMVSGTTQEEQETVISKLVLTAK